MTPDINIQKLTQLSSKKLVLLQDMLVLTQAQSNTIIEDGIESLQKNIEEKQTKIDEIDRIDEEFSSCFRNLKQELNIERLDELKSPDIPGVKELQDVIERIMELINEISRIETENNDKAKKLMNTFSAQIKKINQGKAINAAYGRKMTLPPPSYFIDSKK